MTLTDTTVAGIRALVFLALWESGAPVSPRNLARRLGASPSYMAKICGLLVRAGILRSRRGATGGVTLNRSPSDVTLLDIVEACQGRVLENYCHGAADPEAVCAFHEAMLELHDCIVGNLSRCTLADLAARPGPSREIRQKVECRIGVLAHQVRLDEEQETDG